MKIAGDTKIRTGTLDGGMARKRSPERSEDGTGFDISWLFPLPFSNRRNKSAQGCHRRNSAQSRRSRHPSMPWNNCPIYVSRVPIAARNTIYMMLMEKM